MDYYSIGFVAGLLAVFILLPILKKFNKKKGVGDFDERQLIARNTAYKNAFFSFMLYSVLCAMLDVFEIKWAEVSIQMFLGIFISVGVFFTIAIFNDAYFSYTEKNSNSYIILCAIIIISNCISFIINVVFEEASILTNGMLNQNVLNLFIVVLFTVLLIMVIIKNVINKRTVEDEE